jgi:thiopeptide-type bacteriocin biosynthesis protein
VRTPLLSGDVFRAERGQSFEERLQGLRQLVATAPLRRALGAASPSLVKALEAERRVGDIAIDGAIMRYVERMRGRPTPFGLCAGYSLGATGRETNTIELAPMESYTAVFRVDVDVVARAVDAATREELRGARLTTSRDTLVFGDVLKVARRALSGEVTYPEIPRTEALDAVLDHAREGASFTSLVGCLGRWVDGTNEAEAIVEHAFDLGLLVPEATPSVATDDELRGLDALSAHRAGVEAARRGRLLPIDARPSGVGSTFGSDERSGIHDLLKPIARGSLGDDVLRELARLIPIVRALSRPRPDERFRRLREHLRQRFENREVPLVEALDPARGFDFPASPERLLVDDPWDALRLELYTRALDRRAHEVMLEDDDLEDLRAQGHHEHDVFGALFRLARTPEGAPSIDNLALVGAPGTQFFARATGFSEELRDLCREHLRVHAAALGDEDVADIAYFVPGRSASFVQFPNLQPFQLVLTTKGSAPTERQIDVNDLLLSVRGDRFVLRSRKTGRAVRVRPVGAANPDRAEVSSVARFLSVVGREESWGASFSWGPLAEAPFLPRVRFGRHVLASATWNLDRRRTRDFVEAKTPDEAFAAMSELRASLALPRHVLYAERADHLLPVDLDDPLSVYAWHGIAKEKMTLCEASALERSMIGGPEGRFHHELAVAFLPSKVRAVETYTMPTAFDETLVFDRVTPGGPVLYLKIYGDRDVLAALVTDVLRDDIVDAVESGDVSHWFFLPYLDPDPHLRLRFFGEPDALYGRLLVKLRERLERLVGTRTVHRFAVDTYERETLRYGGREGMDVAERIFQASSEAAVLFHDEQPLRMSEAEVLVRLVHSHAALLTTAGLDVEKSRDAAAFVARRYQRARDPMVPRRRSGELFRELRTRLIELPSADDLFGADTATRFRAGFEALRAHETTLSVPFRTLCADLMHVHTVRHLTPWHPTPNMEELIYLTLEKTLALRGALTGQSGRRKTL